MFKLLHPETDDEITFDFEGTSISARPGDSVAAALLVANIDTFRETPVRGRPRGPFCMMGACFDCLMVIDGEANQQACQILVSDGIKVARQLGAAKIINDSETDDEL